MRWSGADARTGTVGLCALIRVDGPIGDVINRRRHPRYPPLRKGGDARCGFRVSAHFAFRIPHSEFISTLRTLRLFDRFDAFASTLHLRDDLRKRLSFDELHRVIVDSRCSLVETCERLDRRQKANEAVGMPWMLARSAS